MPEWADLKRTTREAVHDGFSVTALYTDDVVYTPVRFRVRLHMKGRRAGIDEADGAEILETVDKVIFNRGHYAFAYTREDGHLYGGVTPKRGGQLAFPAYAITVDLDSQEEEDGPVSDTWLVTRT